MTSDGKNYLKMSFHVKSFPGSLVNPLAQQTQAQPGKTSFYDHMNGLTDRAPCTQPSLLSFFRSLSFFCERGRSERQPSAGMREQTCESRKKQSFLWKERGMMAPRNTSGQTQPPITRAAPRCRLWPSAYKNLLTWLDEEGWGRRVGRLATMCGIKVKLLSRLFFFCFFFSQ